MFLIINDKEYSFKFGIGFVRDLDAKNSISQNGATYGMGVEVAVSKLIMKDVVALSDLLVTANKTETPKILQKDLDGYIDSEDTDIEALFDEVIEDLKKSNATRLKTVSALNTAAEAEAKEKAMNEARTAL